MVWSSNPDEIFHTHPDRPWGPPNLLFTGFRVFAGHKVVRHPHQVLRLEKE
jgi:hypothetical protein